MSQRANIIIPYKFLSTKILFYLYLKDNTCLAFELNMSLSNDQIITNNCYTNKDHKEFRYIRTFICTHCRIYELKHV